MCEDMKGIGKSEGGSVKIKKKYFNQIALGVLLSSYIIYRAF